MVAFALITLDDVALADIAFVELCADVRVIVRTRQVLIFEVMVIVEKLRHVEIAAVLGLRCDMGAHDANETAALVARSNVTSI